MRHPHKYVYNAKTGFRRTQLLHCRHTEVLIPEDDSVRLLRKIMEVLDYSNLYKAYSHKGRNPVVSPKTLFKFIVYGYMNLMPFS